MTLLLPQTPITTISFNLKNKNHHEPPSSSRTKNLSLVPIVANVHHHHLHPFRAQPPSIVRSMCTRHLRPTTSHRTTPRSLMHAYAFVVIRQIKTLKYFELMQ